MTPSDPDYSRYNLEQLYDIGRRIDKERFPERYAALQQEIALKQANPASNALNVARALVGIEYTLFALIIVLPAIFIPGILTIAMIFVGLFLYALLFSGVAILRASLSDIRDEHSVELWSLVALGIAPSSAAIYTAISVYVLSLLNYYAPVPKAVLYLVPLAGFYTPFILASLWVKYHYRDDEF